MQHNYDFDPTYGYQLDDLLRVPAPLEPTDFEAFWSRRFQETLTQPTALTLLDQEPAPDGYTSHRVTFPSTGGWTLKGWLTQPAKGPIHRVLVWLHGYGGCAGPNWELPLEGTAQLFPGLRGLTPSLREGFPSEGQRHVIHGIEDKHTYVIGGCVEDAWMAIGAMLERYPQAKQRLGLVGGSFGGGIGALALPWDPRVTKAHLQVPTFGNHPLRLLLPTQGSGAALIKLYQTTGQIPPTLAYFDSATAARRITIPMHVTAALFDPSVAPPGQFAVYNAIRSPKQLQVVAAGHHQWPGDAAEVTERFRRMRAFFADL